MYNKGKNWLSFVSYWAGGEDILQHSKQIIFSDSKFKCTHFNVNEVKNDVKRTWSNNTQWKNNKINKNFETTYAVI